MPTCRPSTLRSSATTARTHRNSHARSLRSSTQIGRHHASTAAALAQSMPKAQSDRPSIKTVLHKAESFLPRVLSLRDDPAKTTSLKFWQAVLKQAYHDLNTAAPKRAARIVVYGCDECSGAEELVTALLEEPFSSASQRQAVQTRWRNARERSSLTIGYGHASSEELDAVRIPAAWLQQFAVPVEIQEIKQSLGPTHDAPNISSLFEADVPIIVCNPLTTPLSQILSNPSLPLNHANAILVIVTTPNSPPGTWKHVAGLLPVNLTTVFVDPSLAIGAIRTLSLDTGSSLSVQRYQDDYTGSRVSDLTNRIAQKLALASNGDIVGLHEFTACEQIQASLAACRQVLQTADTEVGRVSSDVLQLRDAMAEMEAKVVPEVLGSENNKAAAEAVAKAKKEVETVMNSLTWWRAVTRVDDVGETMRAAVNKAWCRDLEDKLIFHSGRLASFQQSLAQLTIRVLSRNTPSSPFYSPVLENSLCQLQASSSYTVQPNSLTLPIYQRKVQLEYPTQLLHSTAQRVALGTGGSVMSGLGLAWAGWAEHLGAFGGLVGTGMEVETTAGAGMLMTALGIRWMVGRWEKAKRRWWRDWDRVGQGLERDLTASLDRTVANQVTMVPRTACESLSQMAAKRKNEIEALKEELDDLQHEIGRS